METKVIKASGDENLDRDIMMEAGNLIRSGELVAIPTETVYGLAGDALNPLSASKIYAAKGRPSDNPLIVHIAEKKALFKIAETVPEKAEILINEFWPGPLTIIFRKTPAVPKETTGGLDTVAVRMPVNDIAREFILSAGGYIAAPSANSSGKPSCTTAEHVYEDMKGKIPLIIDGGKVGIGLESTIVDMSGEIPCLLRPGMIDIGMLREKIGEVEIDPSIEGVMDENARPKAPGMKYKHYSPRGELYIVKGKRERVISEINSRCADAAKKELRTAVMACEENIERYRADIVESVGSREEPGSIARNLFSVLRDMDKNKADLIFSEEYDVPGMGMAIMNRLVRAAGHKIIDTDK